MVEQDEDLMAVLTEELRAAGWDVAPATSVGEAKDLTSTVDAIDVAIVDERGPTPDGLPVEEWLYRDDVLAKIPLVMMTASVPDAPAVHRCPTIEKPFKVPELIGVLRRTVRVSR